MSKQDTGDWLLSDLPDSDFGGSGFVAVNQDSRDRGRQNQRDGEAGQIIAQYTLQQMGLGRVQAIYTPWKVLWKTVRGRRVVDKAFPLRKVDGDFIAVVPGTGQSVLVEVKRRGTRDTLRWSDLEAHQREALDDHIANGGLSLVAWVLDNNECIILPWPIPGLGFRRSIDWDAAVTVQWTGV